LFSTLALVGLIGGWLLFLRPPLLGGATTLVIVSGASMEPRLHPGDLVLVRREVLYDRGDVVVFRVRAGEPGAGAMVVHRIIGGSAASGYRVQGDNRALADLWRPRGDDIVGRSLVTVPNAGHLIATLGTPLGAGAVAGLLVFVYALGGSRPRPAPGRRPVEWRAT
jgi:signal peptidase I